VSLHGRVALVTGGASGVGRTAARLYAEAGAHVAVADWDAGGANSVTEELKAQGHSALAVEVDIADDQGVGRMMESVVAEYNKIDIVFNNAAVGPSAAANYTMANVVDTPSEAWDAILAINLKGPALVSRHALPHMVRAGSGVITNNASINGIVAIRGADAYTASKGGLVALTRAMAAEWGPHGIRVNCLCPGPIDTPMNAPYLGDAERLQAMTARIPVGRVATPEEIAAVAVFLSTDSASYISGAIIPIDGGWTAA
jgi:NAD(P)-dependent dehydrogenase (short-subunit alcohol dehydrogenase family)